MNNLIHTLFESNLRTFANSFKNTAYEVFYDKEKEKLIHPGEYGSLRESILREFLREFLPESYGVSQGFVISPGGFVSKQCDVIIYSKQYTPGIKTPEHQRFFPVESVLGIIEVKSIADSSTLRQAIGNLQEIKKIRERIKSAIAYQRPEIKHYNPRKFPRDQIGTYVFCERIDCSIKIVTEILRDTSIHEHPSHQINMLCSIDDYCTAYRVPEDKCWMHSIDVDGSALPLFFCKPKANSVGNLKVFFRYLLMILEDTTIMKPELTNYFEGMFDTEVWGELKD